MMSVVVPVAAAVGLIVAFCLASWISKADEGTDRMKEISGFIREGAMAFLRREYKTMAIVIAVLFLLIGFGLQNWAHGGALRYRRAAVCSGRLLRHDGSDQR